jgi:hypothetical protein
MLFNEQTNQNTLEHFCKPEMIVSAQAMLCEQEMSEEAFLGAQCVLLLNGLL